MAEDYLVIFSKEDMKSLLWIFSSLLCFHAVAENIDSSHKYVFYLHGAIIEEGNLRPTHEKYGLYDYPAIISSLSKFDFQLISEQRQPDTDYFLYAKKIVSEINELFNAGVKPKNITIAGFSKGAMITVVTSSLLESDELNFVIMATCGEWYDSNDFLKGLRLRGNVLSIYEKSDIAGSCQSLVSRLPAPSTFIEIEIDTGKKHGAFYLPRDEWIKPLVSWVNRK